MTDVSTDRVGGYDVDRVRAEFAILDRNVNGHPLVYLDSANTSQTPRGVLDAMRAHQETHNSNVGRSVCTLGTEATRAYEAAREKVAIFVRASTPGEIVFTRNSTEAINLVAHAFGNGALGRVDPRFRLGPGDEIVVTELEHHSNLIPWQLLCQRTGATLRWLPITGAGRLDLSELDDIVNERTRLVAFVHTSNILGTTTPVARIVERARAVGALTLLDGSQSVPHQATDVRELGVDFLAFTGHKMCAPTGVGALWARSDLLEAMPPFLGGGSMIGEVTMSGATYADPPARFEAGTPAIVPAIGLGAAVDYLSALGMDAVHAHERRLTAHALETMAAVPGLRIFGPDTPEDRGSAISFTIEGVTPRQVGDILDEDGIQVRVGRHCAAPVCAHFGVDSTVRASFYLYTTMAEIDALGATLAAVRDRVAAGGATSRAA